MLTTRSTDTPTSTHPATTTPTASTPRTTTGPQRGDTTDEDIANQLLSGGAQAGPAKAPPADLPTLRDIVDKTRAYREGLGLAATDDKVDEKLVAVSSGIDLEKDSALCGFLAKHTEIDTVKPEVFGKLGKLAGALSSAEEASTPLGLNLLQTVIDIDAEIQRTSGRVADMLAKPPGTAITPTLTVGEARVLFADFRKTLGQQQQTEQSRSDRHRCQKQRVDKQVTQAQQTLSTEESVRRLRNAARTNQALPAKKGQKDKPSK